MKRLPWLSRIKLSERPALKKQSFEPKNYNKPTRRELIRLALHEHCNHDPDWWIEPDLAFWLTFKVIVCIIMGWEAKHDRPRWELLYGKDSPNRFDDFWETPVVVAHFGYHEYQTMEYTAHEWRELVVGRWNEDWRYVVVDDSAE